MPRVKWQLCEDRVAKKPKKVTNKKKQHWERKILPRTFISKYCMKLGRLNYKKMCGSGILSMTGQNNTRIEQATKLTRCDLVVILLEVREITNDSTLIASMWMMVEWAWSNRRVSGKISRNIWQSCAVTRTFPEALINVYVKFRWYRLTYFWWHFNNTDLLNKYRVLPLLRW